MGRQGQMSLPPSLQNIPPGLASITIIGGVLLAVVIYRLTFHPLSKVPGPKLAAVSGLWRTYLYATGSWHDDIIALHKQYGAVVRIAPDEVSVVDSSTVKQLYGHGTSAKKSHWYETWDLGKPAFFSATDSRLHSKLRKRVSSAYSMSAILRYETYIQSCLDLCFQKFGGAAKEGKVLDLAWWINALAYDIVGEIAFGTKFGHLETENDVMGMREAISKGFYLSANSGHFWGQRRFWDNPLTAFVSSLLNVENPVTKLADYAKTLLAARLEGKDDCSRQDMLSHFISMKSIDGSGQAGEDEMLIEAMNILGAGADTTSVGMTACIYYLGLYPEAYRRLQEEIDTFYASKGLNEPATFDEAYHLPFLKAVVSEALRLFPSIIFQLLRTSPGMSINGIYIPAGYDIGMSPKAQNRDQAVFGPDADEFRPERWLDAPGVISAYERANMTFGGNGPRGCIGKNIALVEIYKFVSQFMHIFDFEFENKEAAMKVFSSWSENPSELWTKVTVRPGRTV